MADRNLGTGSDPGEGHDRGPSCWRFDMHTHSRYSGDSTTDPKKIADLFSDRRILSLVTDHNTTAGSSAVYAEIRRENREIPFIMSEEIMTESGEIIGLFLTEEVHP